MYIQDKSTNNCKYKSWNVCLFVTETKKVLYFTYEKGLFILYKKKLRKLFVKNIIWNITIKVCL